jgi:hypothetical protein
MGREIFTDLVCDGACHGGDGEVMWSSDESRTATGSLRSFFPSSSTAPVMWIMRFVLAFGAPVVKVRYCGSVLEGVSGAVLVLDMVYWCSGLVSPELVCR